MAGEPKNMTTFQSGMKFIWPLMCSDLSTWVVINIFVIISIKMMFTCLLLHEVLVIIILLSLSSRSASGLQQGIDGLVGHQLKDVV